MPETPHLTLPPQVSPPEFALSAALPHAVLGIEVIPLIALGIDLKLISLHGFLNLLLGKKVVFRRV